MAKKAIIKNNINPTTPMIDGNSTWNQLQSINPVNLSVMNINVNTVRHPMPPDELLLMMFNFYCFNFKSSFAA